MTGVREHAAAVALLRLGGRPASEWAELVQQRESAVRVLEEHASGGGDQLNLLSGEFEMLLDQALADVAGWQMRGLHVLTVLDPGYPANLHEVHDRPLLVFVRGQLVTADERSVAVVGARDASSAGRQAARTVAAGLVAAGFVIVSGLARGIDTAAHVAALDAGGRTVAVIGTGLLRCYPPENRGLADRVAAAGAVVSQFWPQAGPESRTFPLRNAVMSGLARATVVIEASARSGARLQSRLALAHGRPVFLMRPLLEQEWARDLARRPGVHVVDEAREIATIVNRLAATNALTA